MTFGTAMRAEWKFDPGVTYLNHGTVGAPPHRVLVAQQAIRDEIERHPSKFLLRDASRLVGVPTGEPTRVRRAAIEVATFVGSRPDDLVFVDNATTGTNTVLRALRIAPGDEILVTDHAYGAVTRTVNFIARERQAVVRTVRVPYPPFSSAGLVQAVQDAITPKTRVAVLDHVTSESALIFPLAELAAVCRARGVPVLADGAHVPGMLPLDLPSLGVDWYTANLHKWAHAPQTVGILWVAPSRQADLHPLVISWGYEQGFVNEFDWIGTRDPSAWLAAPAGIAFLDEMGFDAQRRANHDLAWSAATMLAERWKTTIPAQESEVGSMVTLPLPKSAGAADAAAAARLRDRLLFEHNIEVQLHAGHGQLWTRVSAQVYNTMEDFVRLADAIVPS
jgi:isopenicillin-N epimerase